MALHLRPIPKRPKADTRALATLRQMVLTDLKRLKSERADHAPRHFKDAEHFRKHGELPC